MDEQRIAPGLRSGAGHGRSEPGLSRRFVLRLWLLLMLMLDDRLHRSNGKNFIGKYVPDYRGEEFYRASPAVRDRCGITANGLAPFAFAAEIFRALAPEREHDTETYEKLYSRGLLA